MTWTLLSGDADSTRPLARGWHGFTSAGGKLYIHGGYLGKGVWCYENSRKCAK